MQLTNLDQPQEQSACQKTVEPVPKWIQGLAHEAGVTFGGSDPWDVRVSDPRLYQRIARQGTLGFGEGFVDGQWECDAPDELICRLLRAGTDSRMSVLFRAYLTARKVRDRLLNRQAKSRAFQVGEQHYDAGNDIFAAMLDDTMTYSCGYWRTASDLQQAQLDKFDLICRKLQLRPGEKLLDIGCGWGGLAHYAAVNYGVSVVGITVSERQHLIAQQRCEGLDVEIKLQDYRELVDTFDKVVSVGMFEHVGPKNYANYFDMVSRLLTSDGLFLLHSIGIDRYTDSVDPWIEKWIFPNGRLPSAIELTQSLDRRFLIEDWHNFGQDYDKTLMAWWHNFNRAWPDLAPSYNERFYRMWKLYLLGCAGFFRSRQGQLWQLVLSKPTRSAQYLSVR
ncbi:Cyclopropane-fatty-acyl-phospholipid synthase family [Chondrus crispus]|uniref:Cyclopropane-fatty-acyl-phospholipid synthase family n=1 Tax=Chondrus crispus TaxID=2769 RepID=R7Q7I4_CHOCR|nr:Cyclopropane-fatty-acyl-phospholipid synthase family [Chondrus crispus]CDF34472.1 Cyclopropane-fatty-acyl-phospholipid synthase family [Chondrus crispus]|eukprot:XP_005714291.1 Cyclopropane-fatty-acyl-phospholipid synthase family [Chondrus crispus]